MVSLERFNNKFLVIWIATLGVENVNFIPSFTFFNVTPFLLLSFLFLPYFLVSSGFKIKLLSIKALYPFALFFLILIANSIVSIEPMHSFKKFALILIEGAITAIIGGMIMLKDNYRQIFSSGAKLGILLALVFSLGQVISTFVFGYDVLNVATHGIITMMGKVWGSFGFRVTGVSVDPNRGAFVIIFYLFVLLKIRGLNKNILWIALSFLLIFITLSKSAFLALFVLFLFLIPNIKISKRKIFRLTIVLVTVLFSVFYIAHNVSIEGFDLLKTIGDRFSLNSGAAKSHESIAFVAFDVWSTNAKYCVLGTGYGTAYKFLTSFFSGDLGNFHSLYLSFLVEGGIIGLVSIMILLLFPLFYKNSSYRPIIISLLVFNMFYQTYADPLFWLILSLGYINKTLSPFSGAK